MHQVPMYQEHIHKYKNLLIIDIKQVHLNLHLLLLEVLMNFIMDLLQSKEYVHQLLQQNLMQDFDVLFVKIYKFYKNIYN